jgi:hypothetical protein
MVEQPHFDDELTVLTAQPVVPLEQIEKKARHRRRWFLSGAFAIAMLLGAASALVSAYFRVRNVPDPELQTTAESSEAEPETAVTEPPVTASMLPVSEEPVGEEVEEVEAQPAPTPAPKRSAPVRITRHTSEPVFEPRLDEEDELRRIRDAVLVEQWQERRARRIERRERRRAQHRDRDLSNIDEIFEGPRRRP